MPLMQLPLDETDDSRLPVVADKVMDRGSGTEVVSEVGGGLDVPLDRLEDVQELLEDTQAVVQETHSWVCTDSNEILVPPTPRHGVGKALDEMHVEKIVRELGMGVDGLLDQVVDGDVCCLQGGEGHHDEGSSSTHESPMEFNPVDHHWDVQGSVVGKLNLPISLRECDG
ncbi:hypothetical protein Acr_17g0000750 [Actinidia rufa]|uniref:Uncharacterized protein n=1 Tax=Actinidia rufa TaxID=165716 RepID=A0A7J0G0R0_9ERIC|nr:hypothetical protein Acr_17g0000750 [Actinidia rufa]